jgi:hypothetical protein
VLVPRRAASWTRKYAPDSLAPGELLVSRRVAELRSGDVCSAIDRIEFLDYVDSGMEGEDTAAPGSFWDADVDGRGSLARISKVSAAYSLCRDDHGGYGHPEPCAVPASACVQPELHPGTHRVLRSDDEPRSLRRLIRFDAQEIDEAKARPSIWNADHGDQITTTATLASGSTPKRAAMGLCATRSRPTPSSYNCPMKRSAGVRARVVHQRRPPRTPRDIPVRRPD